MNFEIIIYKKDGDKKVSPSFFRITSVPEVASTKNKQKFLEDNYFCHNLLFMAFKFAHTYHE